MAVPHRGVTLAPLGGASRGSAVAGPPWPLFTTAEATAGGADGAALPRQARWGGSHRIAVRGQALAEPGAAALCAP